MQQRCEASSCSTDRRQSEVQGPVIQRVMAKLGKQAWAQGCRAVLKSAAVLCSCVLQLYCAPVLCSHGLYPCSPGWCD